MPFIKNNHIDFKVENNKIILSKQYLEKNKSKFKKITGSRFATILNMSTYTSPVKMWSIMTNIYKEEMDSTLSYVGQKIEPLIKTYVEKITNFNFLSYDPKTIGWDVFKENKIFGGIPDGEPIDINGQINYLSAPMLEIKTTSRDSLTYYKKQGVMTMKKGPDNIPIIKEKNKKYESWFESGKIKISDEYLLQLSLYLYLRNTNKGMFAIAFLEPIDYAKPELFDIDKREIRLVNIDIDLKQFQFYINKATNWYNEFIKTGMSPELLPGDFEWLKQEGII